MSSQKQKPRQNHLSWKVRVLSTLSRANFENLPSQMYSKNVYVCVCMCGEAVSSYFSQYLPRPQNLPLTEIFLTSSRVRTTV